MLPCLCNVGIEASIWTVKTESEEAGCGPPALARYRSSASAGVNCWAEQSIGNSSGSNVATAIAALSDGSIFCEKRTSVPRSHSPPGPTLFRHRQMQSENGLHPGRQTDIFHSRSANDRAIAFWCPLENPFDFRLATELPCRAGGICRPKCRLSAVVIIGLRGCPD